MGNASLHLSPRLADSTPFTLSAKGRDRCLPVALGHFEVALRVISEIWVVVFVSPAQRLNRELRAPHVRLQLLQRKRSVSARQNQSPPRRESNNSSSVGRSA